MKHIFLLLLLSFCLACKNQNNNATSNQTIAQSPKELGQEIFDGKGTCYTCHKEDKKTIGPSVQEIATIYANKKASIVNFLKNDASPIVDPSQYETMKTNFSITKNLTTEELNALETYIMSYHK